MPMVSNHNASKLLYVLYMHKSKHPLPYISNGFCTDSLSPLLKEHVCFEALLVCMKIKLAEDFTSVLAYSSLLKLRTTVWIVKANTKILDFNFLQWDCNETDAQFCDFVMMFLWLILVSEPSSLLRISMNNENTKICTLQILQAKTSCT